MQQRLLRHALIGLVLWSVAFGSGPALASLVPNGSFEEGAFVPDANGRMTLYYGDTNITGWTVRCLPPPPICSIDWVGSYWKAADGERSLDLAGLTNGGVLSNSFATVVGQKYALRFAMAGNPDDISQPVKTMAVTVGGVASREYTFDIRKPGGGFYDHVNMGWQWHEWVFTATSDRTFLDFENKPGLMPPYYGAALDAVSVTAVVPEPASIVIWSLLGLSCAGLRVRQRRGRARV